MRRIDLIVIHCSDSPYGNRETIDVWHKQRGWKGIGYHFVIMNCYPTQASYASKTPQPDMDGCFEIGRFRDEIGAHVKGHNRNSLGICLIGDDIFTSKQFERLTKLVAELKGLYPDAKITRHCDLDNSKTCPNISKEFIDTLLA